MHELKPNAAGRYEVRHPTLNLILEVRDARIVRILLRIGYTLVNNPAIPPDKENEEKHRED